MSNVTLQLTVAINPDHDVVLHRTIATDTTAVTSVISLMKVQVLLGPLKDRIGYVVPNDYIPQRTDYTMRRYAVVFRDDVTTLYHLLPSEVVAITTLPPQ